MQNRKPIVYNDKIVHTHTHTHIHIYIRWNISHKIPFFAIATTWMYLEDIMLMLKEIRQILYVITYMWNLKNKTNS